MKSLKHICEETERLLQGSWSGMVAGNLYKELFDWAGELEIFAFSIKQDNHTLLIACEDIEDDKEEKRFYIFRAFPGSAPGKWHVSADQNAVTRNEMVDFLMNKRK